jgi:Type III restriction enzyme, res subunit
MPQPKPFQNAAIAAACASFQSAKGSKRFLVADEVGLGKTVVAQQVIQRLAGAGRRSPLIVYYITNGQRVAHQNRDRLVNFLSEDDQKAALSKADRLNVIPLFDIPKTPVILYALTPGTSFPGKTTRLHAGRKEERAFLTALLGRAYPHLVRKLPENAMRRNVTSDWEGLVHRFRGSGHMVGIHLHSGQFAERIEPLEQKQLF